MESSLSGPKYRRKSFPNNERATSKSVYPGLFRQDCTHKGYGAVLVQEVNGKSRAVCYASSSLGDVEWRYSQTEKEALALEWASEWLA